MRLALITKSFAPDFDLCAALNRSVLDYSPNGVRHQIIVPQSDLTLFGKLAGPRTQICCDTEFLPATFVHVPLTNLTVNIKKPFPPVRGWIQQQVIKLAAVAASDADVVLTADSDVEFIRSFSAEMFVRDGIVRFYREPHKVDQRLPRHVTWHGVARALLGLRPATQPFSDYISSILTWDPKIVRRMLAHVEATTKRSWFTAIAGQLDFSECILYGVFVDHICGAPSNAFASDDPLCRAYWDTIPLDRATARDFIDRAQPSDIAAMISAKSRTTQAVRDSVFAALRSKPDQQNDRETA